MNKESAIAFLEDFAGLMQRYPDVRLFYTTSDDGVHLEFDNSPKLKDVDINLGYRADTAFQQCRDFAQWLRTTLEPTV